MTPPPVLHTARLATRATPRVNIERILHPRSVAVLGASESKAKFGGRIMSFLVQHGFAGELYPINLNRTEVLGRKAYASIGAVPAPPDVAILAVPPHALVPSVREAAEAGVGCCVIITTGFAEAGPEGVARQAELVDISGRTGTRLIGPNCMGLIVPHHHLALCSSVVLDTERLLDGTVSLVSQSGALMVSIYDRAATDGIGFRACVSCGNQSDLELCDFIEHLVGDPGTEAICVYVEGWLDGARFRRCAAAARAANKPLLVLKTGRTQAGVESARSHTASLAGSFEVFQAVCREEGVVLPRDPDDMVRAAHFLVRHRAPRRGGGVAILSGSGGGAGIAADRVSELGLRLAALSPETRAKLDPLLLPPQALNPIDLGGRKPPEEVEIAGDVTRVLFADPDVAYGLAILTSMPFFANRARLIAEASQASNKPVMMAFTPGAAADGPRKALRDIGQFYFDRVEDALRVIALVAEYDTLRAMPPTRAERPAGLPATAPVLRRGSLTEAEVRRVLADYGVRIARGATAATPEAAGDAATKLGFPVVLKAVSRSIVHKSDVGAVRLGLASREAVEAAAREMASRLGPLDGFTVQETVAGEAEVIVGARRDPQFGPVVLVGLGGIAVEILKDVALAPAPVSAVRARAVIDSLAAAPLLHGARGRPPVDVDAIVDAVVRVSWLAADLGPRLVDFEVNPLIVRRASEGAVAVDVRGRLEDS